MALYVINTLVSYRMRYVVEAESRTDAEQSLSNTYFNEFSQKCLGEQLIDTTEIDYEEFLTLNRSLVDNESEIGSPWLGDKLINKTQP